MSFETNMQTVEELLAMADVQGCDPLTPTELLGFFYGLAITPADIATGEWMEVLFANGLPEFESKKQAENMYDALFRVLDDFVDAFESGELGFPYDIEDPDGWSPEELDEWAYGFHNALLLKPDCWFVDKPDAELSEEEEELLDSIAVLASIAEPDTASDYFEDVPGPEDEDEDGFWLALFESLPAAVETLQAHAIATSRQHQATAEERKGRRPQIVPPKSRNDPCPCASGKTFKDCCMRKSKIVPLH